MSDAEYRYFDAEFRVEDGVIRGTLLRYGDVARIGSFSERFEADALDISGDVIANLMHNRERPIARTGAGLELRREGDRVNVALTPSATGAGRDAVEMVTANLLRGFSMEFLAKEDRWEGQERIVGRAQLTGLGVVDRPAYSDSTIAARMRDALPPRPRRRRVYV